MRSCHNSYHGYLLMMSQSYHLSKPHQHSLLKAGLNKKSRCQCFGIKQINPRDKYKHIISKGAAFFLYIYMIDTYRNCSYATTEQVFYKQTFFIKTDTLLCEILEVLYFFNSTCINVKNQEQFCFILKKNYELEFEVKVKLLTK